MKLATLFLPAFLLAFVLICPTAGANDATRPNFVVIFADDLGYGDLSCYGHPTIHTPRLDRMAAEGMRFTQFYSAAPVCTPSRAGLLTGRLPIRSGLCGRRRVLFPDSTGGLPDDEVTLAELLSSAGYATACIGKWHLGHLPQYLPTRHGFDYYFGLPYSNDMHGRPAQHNRPAWQPLPLMRNEEIVETDPDQGRLTERYTDEAIGFIRRTVGGAKPQPFFVYLPHTMPHVPLHASSDDAGRSLRGLFGDVVEAIDASTGRILDALNELGVAENTLVFFSSDNGPWLTQKLNGGSAGCLRDGKGSTWEGGMREPGIAWWPGHVPAAKVSHAMSSTLDLLPTFCHLADVAPPSDRPLDGYDLSKVFLEGDAVGPRDTMFYYRDAELFAVRRGPWKLHLRTQAGYSQPQPDTHEPPLLFHLDHDPGESFDVAKNQPQVVAELQALIRRHLEDVKPGKNQLD